MGVGAERPKTWGGSSQKFGRIDRVWGGRGAVDPGGSTLGRIDRYPLQTPHRLVIRELVCP